MKEGTKQVYVDQCRVVKLEVCVRSLSAQARTAGFIRRKRCLEGLVQGLVLAKDPGSQVNGKGFRAKKNKSTSGGKREEDKYIQELFL